MSGGGKVNSLVSSTTRYILGRNATQISYWRKAAGNRLVKYTRTVEFDPAQKMPIGLRNKQYHNTNYNMTK
ncbi:uncharacterized protein LOC142234121 [Haematobia irritans]|uniref:Uncharacterized protein n=1 Tax=Haematobia irritans TaxID=7368 RepID=A0A1L8EAX4_HAEIR